VSEVFLPKGVKVTSSIECGNGCASSYGMKKLMFQGEHTQKRMDGLTFEGDIVGLSNASNMFHVE